MTQEQLVAELRGRVEAGSQDAELLLLAAEGLCQARQIIDGFNDSGSNVIDDEIEFRDRDMTLDEAASHWKTDCGTNEPATNYPIEPDPDEDEDDEDYKSDDLSDSFFNDEDDEDDDFE